MSTSTTPEVIVADLGLNTPPDVPITGLVLTVQKNRKQVEKTSKETERKASKWKCDADKLSKTNIPIVCHLEKHLVHNSPPNTVGRSIVQYLHSLQQNNVTPRPTNWSLVLLNPSVQRKNNLSLSDEKKDKELAKQNMWHRLSLNHYYVASTNLEFKAQLD